MRGKEDLDLKFIALTERQEEAAVLSEDYKGAREIGVVKLGSRHLFFRKGLKHYVIPFADITGYFRRVLLVQASICCGKGDLPIENLVVCSKAGEIAQIQLPGEKAAKALMEELKILLPGVDCKGPAKKAEK